VNFYLHGKLADEPLWLRVRMSEDKLWDVDARDIDELFVRDPKAKIIPTSPAPEPWGGRNSGRTSMNNW
jgi:hypothetical protein